jgi:hypothetical protein
MPGRRLEYAVPVSVDRQGYAVSGNYVFQQPEVALGVLLYPEQSMGHLASGIIYGAYQAEPWPSVFQPIMVTGVYLQEHALLRVPFPPTAVARRPSLPRTAQAGSEQNTPYCRARQPQTFTLRQHL